MKNFLLLMAGVCTAAAGLAWLESTRKRPVEVLAHKLEEAWADHHTVA